MNLTNQLKLQAKKLKVPTQWLVFADLIVLGYSEREAYIIAYPEESHLSLIVQKHNIEEITRQKKFLELINYRKNRHGNFLSVANDAKNIANISNEEIAMEILVSAKSQPEDSLARANLFIKYLDFIDNLEKPIIPDGTQDIHYYLPIKCRDNCPLYLEYRKAMDTKGSRDHQDINNFKEISRRVHEKIKILSI